MTISTGIDIVEVKRVRSLIDRFGDRFLGRWFDNREILYCAAKARPYQHFAARLAAKEATVKVLGMRGRDGIVLKDIVVLVSETTGEPSLLLVGRARSRADARGISGISLSLSHCTEYAVASVVAVISP